MPITGLVPVCIRVRYTEYHFRHLPLFACFHQAQHLSYPAAAFFREPATVCQWRVSHSQVSNSKENGYSSTAFSGVGVFIYGVCQKAGFYIPVTRLRPSL